MVKNTKIVGNQVALDADRSVFVGSCVDRPGTYFLQFRNGETVKRFTLSPDAGVALRALLYRDDGHGEPKEYDAVMDDDSPEWRHVERDAEITTGTLTFKQTDK